MNRYHYFSHHFLNEAEYIEASKKDINNFSFLYEHYYIPIFRFIMKRVVSEDIAADITSQVFLKAMLNIKNYENRGIPFSCWLIRIAKNEVYLEYRKKKIVRNIDIISEKVPQIIEENNEATLEEEISMLKKAMSKLDPAEVELIDMFYFENMHLKELAYIFNITETNVKVRLFRIRKKLKRIIEKIKSYEQISIFNR